jgi:hypothetical protein
MQGLSSELIIHCKVMFALDVFFKNNDMKYKGLWLLLGYAMMTFGLTALIMQVVGVHWAFLGLLEWGGRLLAFVLKILMTIGGVLIIVFARTDWERERRESEAASDFINDKTIS